MEGTGMMKIPSGFMSLKPPSPEEKLASDKAQLKEAAKGFENQFLNQMVKSMRSTVHHDDGLIKQNFAEQIFTENLDQKYVEGWADRGGVGLADMIYKQISERYFADTKKDFGKAPGMMPIQPGKDAHHFMPISDPVKMKVIEPGPEAKLQYRFEVQDPSGKPYDVQAPLAGKVVDQARLADGWSVLRLDHGQGKTSELTFPGRLAENVSGQEVGTGQKLGVLDPSRPVMAWKFDWT
jgi:Rod binding domain-containing protein